MAKFVPYYGGYGGKMSNGSKWGGEAKIMKKFKKQTGVPKGMGNKAKKLDKSARKSGF